MALEVMGKLDGTAVEQRMGKRKNRLISKEDLLGMSNF